MGVGVGGGGRFLACKSFLGAHCLCKNFFFDYSPLQDFFIFFYFFLEKICFMHKFAFELFKSFYFSVTFPPPPLTFLMVRPLEWSEIES